MRCPNSKERIEELEKSIKNLEKLVSFLLKTGIKLSKSQQNQAGTILKVIDRVEQISTQVINDADGTVEALTKMKEVVSKVLGKKVEVDKSKPTTKKSKAWYVN